MKYKVIEFNVNKPSLKQVTEPLNSQYGLAIKVLKNDTVLPVVE